MKTKTIKLLFATLLVGLFVSCEPAKSYYPWENESPIEKAVPVSENEQTVPQQFSTNAKLLETKEAQTDICFCCTIQGMMVHLVNGKQKNMLYLLCGMMEIHLIPTIRKPLHIIPRLRKPSMKVV